MTGPDCAYPAIAKWIRVTSANGGILYPEKIHGLARTHGAFAKYAPRKDQDVGASERWPTICDYISWYEDLSGKVHFLTDADLPKAKELGITAEDFLGHGAIYTIRGWAKDTEPAGLKQRECTDFSNPGNFPKQIAEAIKKGQMTYGPPTERLLTPAAWAEYQRILKPALAEYERIQKQAWAEYQRILKPAFWTLFAQSENRAAAWR